MTTCSSSAKRHHLSTLLMLTALCVGTVSCGGGGSSESPTPSPPAAGGTPPSPPPPPPPSSVTPAQIADATSLLVLASEMTSALVPLSLVENLQLGGCQTGSVAYTYDGASVAVGSSVTLGSHSLGATFNSCNADGVLYVGGSSVAQFNATANAPPGSSAFAGTAIVTASNLNWISSAAGITRSVVANGPFQSTLTFTTNAATGLNTDRIEVGSTSAAMFNTTPDPDRAATLTGGTVALIVSYTASGRALRSFGYAYNNFALSYTIRGSEDYTFGSTGPTGATGQIEILANGVVTATAVPALPSGWTITSVTGAVGPW
jgi:hypothetical protein